MSILAYLIPAAVVYVFLPSVIFTLVEEDWSYVDAVYYSFVSLTTVGFGDFVAGK